MAAPRALSVLVTGASTGIGRACAERLARGGHRVFAGVRSAAHEAELAALAGVVPLRLEVTDDRSVADGLARVAAELGDAPLDGLVNNAGISVSGPLELLPLDDLRRQFEVNVVGLVRVTQVALPLIRRGRGRVVNIGSVGGRVTTPFVGAYCATKHAVEALTDALRQELAPAGVHVVLIQPGSIATPIWDKGHDFIDEVVAKIPPAELDRYRGALEAGRGFIEFQKRQAIPADRVAVVVERALTARRPRTRYPVGVDAHLMIRLRGWLSDRWIDRVLGQVMPVS